MAIVRYPIKLNVKPSPYPLIKSIALVQGDTANVFAIELQEDKQPFNIEDCYVTATFKKADDNVVILEGEIIDATNGLVDIPIYLQAVSCVGKTYCTIEVYNNNDLRLTSIMFEFDVVEQLGHGEDIESVTEYTILQELIADVQSIKIEEEQRVINENTRIQNEIDRQTVFDGIVNTANTTKDGLDASIIDANNVKSLLDYSITSGNDIKVNLDTSIDNAEPILSDLNTSIDEGNQLKIDLSPLVDNANTSKINLDTTINNANDKKTELDGSISTATTKKAELDTSISTAETTKINLDNSISSANTINDTLSNTTTGTIKKATDINNTLGTTINSANTSKSNLDESIVQSTTSKTNLDSSIANADAKKVELDSSISTASTTKTELDTSITNANTINDTLSNATTGTIKQATDINTALSSSIDIANTSKGDLDTSIDNSTTAKTNLDDSISTANVIKTALDDSITEGHDLKSDLDAIISSTDYEQIITDVNNLKQDQHNHTNKNTLDGLSDVDGKLKYNGQDVGIGDMTKAEFDVDGDGIVDKANDSNKLGGQLPSYYAQKTYVDTELNKKISTTEKGNANGLAELDSGGKVPASQLPSYVDNVLEFSSLSTFPTTGETGKIYVAIDTNLTYRWSGTAYVEISPSIALGETSSTAYRGDRGKIAYDHSQSTHARIDATKTENSTTNGNIKINGTETNVYTHPETHSTDEVAYQGVTATSMIFNLNSNLQELRNNKVDNSRVLTDVPANAKFTDTIIEVVDDINDVSSTKALSARQGFLLLENMNALTTNLMTHVIGLDYNMGVDIRLKDLINNFDEHKAEIATQEQLGHVKAGQNITIDSDGTINAKGGNVDSVNGKTGEVILSASDVGAVPTSRRVNSKALTSDITIDVPDIAGLKCQELALGRASAAGLSSVALGYSASATGSSSVALGDSASAAGLSSVALGYRASAENDNEGILGDAGSYRTSNWKVPGDFTVSGTKNFEIPHPKPEKSATHVIRHGAVESPTPGDTLYRWKVQVTKDNDIVTIDLPDYFIWLNKDVQIFVTPQGHFGNGYGELNRETEQLEIHCQFEGEYNVLVIGTRNDDHQSVQDWYIKGVEREIGESWTGETYAFSVDEIIEVEEIKEVSA